ncbi:MAG: hypothetical protein AAGA48_39215 [Myxococcota bacterium]
MAFDGRVVSVAWTGDDFGDPGLSCCLRDYDVVPTNNASPSQQDWSI